MPENHCLKCQIVTKIYRTEVTAVKSDRLAINWCQMTVKQIAQSVRLCSTDCLPVKILLQCHQLGNRKDNVHVKKLKAAAATKEGSPGLP